MPAPLLVVSFPRLIRAVITLVILLPIIAPIIAVIAVIAGRCCLVHRLGALDRLLWVHLDRRADVLKVDVELVDKIENGIDIAPLGFLLPGGQLDYYVNGGERVSGVANPLQPDALVGVVTLT